MKKTIIIAGLILVVGAGGYFSLQPDQKVTVTEPQVISWVKPTTDAEWAEDVKAESFDIKSTDVLKEMREAHAEKLTRMLVSNQKLFNCPECVKYDIKTDNSDWSDEDVDNAYQNQLNNANYEIDKIKQSIERMDNEIRLRAEGYVVPNKGEDKQADMSRVPQNKIRKIND